MNPLVPSAPSAVDIQTRRAIADLVERCERERRFEVSKLVGFDRYGSPDYPKVTLRIEPGGYGNYVGAVLVQQTCTNRSEFAGSLKDLDVRTAYEYYCRLNSADAVDAIEKVMRAPTPKAWALITLLDRMTQMDCNKEIEVK